MDIICDERHILNEVPSLHGDTPPSAAFKICLWLCHFVSRDRGPLSVWTAVSPMELKKFCKLFFFLNSGMKIAVHIICTKRNGDSINPPFWNWHVDANRVYQEQNRHDRGRILSLRLIITTGCCEFTLPKIFLHRMLKIDGLKGLYDVFFFQHCIVMTKINWT